MLLGTIDPRYRTLKHNEHNSQLQVCSGLIPTHTCVAISRLANSAPVTPATIISASRGIRGTESLQKARHNGHNDNDNEKNITTDASHPRALAETSVIRSTKNATTSGDLPQRCEEEKRAMDTVRGTTTKKKRAGKHRCRYLAVVLKGLAGSLAVSSYRASPYSLLNAVH